MTRGGLEKVAAEFLDSPANTVSPDAARRPHIAGMRIYEAPLFGFAAAEDSYLAGLGDIPEAGIKPLLPRGWLASAQTILSFFLPFSEKIRFSNRGGAYPSPEWLNGRIEGQAAAEELCRRLQEALRGAGHEAVVPALDGRFWSKSLGPENGGPLYTSNWSERHAAYACGLGTFSLSRGLITKKGVAGRFGSLITSLRIAETGRPYTGLYDYCTRCEACLRNCPVGAISREKGKDHVACSQFLGRVKAENSPYYGCGKCQTATPCESGLPGGAGCCA
jgi:epoxyqueuosine reductase QueG